MSGIWEVISVIWVKISGIREELSDIFMEEVSGIWEEILDIWGCSERSDIFREGIGIECGELIGIVGEAVDIGGE